MLLRPLPQEGVIRLNVGGVPYITTASLLAQIPYFESQMRNAQLCSYYSEADDTYFLDRDGEVFGHVLRYLRTNVLPATLPAFDRDLYVVFPAHLWPESCTFEKVL